jgi:hypothetical protein
MSSIDKYLGVFTSLGIIAVASLFFFLGHRQGKIQASLDLSDAKLECLNDIGDYLDKPNAEQEIEQIFRGPVTNGRAKVYISYATYECLEKK